MYLIFLTIMPPAVRPAKLQKLGDNSLQAEEKCLKIRSGQRLRSLK